MTPAELFELEFTEDKMVNDNTRVKLKKFAKSIDKLN